jgi:hypothetical protein
LSTILQQDHIGRQRLSQAIYTRNYEIINAANTVINTSKVTDPKNKTMAAEATFKVACLF